MGPSTWFLSLAVHAMIYCRCRDAFSVASLQTVKINTGKTWRINLMQIPIKGVESNFFFLNSVSSGVSSDVNLNAGSSSRSYSARFFLAPGILSLSFFSTGIYVLSVWDSLISSDDELLLGSSSQELPQ